MMATPARRCRRDTTSGMPVDNGEAKPRLRTHSGRGRIQYVAPTGAMTVILTHSNPYEPKHSRSADRDTEAGVRQGDAGGGRIPDPSHQALLRLLDFERWRWTQVKDLSARLCDTLHDEGYSDLAAIAQGIVAVLDSRQSEEPDPDLAGTVRSIEARVYGKAAYPFINAVDTVDAAEHDSKMATRLRGAEQHANMLTDLAAQIRTDKKSIDDLDCVPNVLDCAAAAIIRYATPPETA